MKRPICWPCKLEMECDHNGVEVRDEQAGCFNATTWSGDVWRCLSCGGTVMIGRGAATILELNSPLLSTIPAIRCLAPLPKAEMGANAKSASSHGEAEKTC